MFDKRRCRFTVIMTALILIFTGTLSNALGENWIRVNKGFQDEAGISFLINLMDDRGESLGSGTAYNAEDYDVWVQDTQNPFKPDSVDTLLNSELGTHYYVCVDVSKTVTKDEMESIKKVLTQFFLSINPSAVTYNKASLWKFGERVTPLVENTGNAAELNAAVQNLNRDEQWTHLFEVIYNVTEKSRGRDNKDNPVVIIITDGEDDQGNNVIFTYDAIARMVEGSGVPMYGVMLPITSKRNPNTTELSELCRKSGGSLQQINSSVDSELPVMLSRIREIAEDTAVVHVPMYNDGTLTKSNADFRLGLVDGNRSMESGVYKVIDLSPNNWPDPTPSPTPTITPTPTPVTRNTPRAILTDEGVTPTPTVTATFDDETEPEPEPEPEPVDIITWIKGHLIIVGGAALALIVLIVLIVVLSSKKKRKDEMQSTNNRHQTNLDDEGTIRPDMRRYMDLSDDDGGTRRGVIGGERDRFDRLERDSRLTGGGSGTYRPMDTDPFSALKNEPSIGSGTVYMGNSMHDFSATGTVRMDDPKRGITLRITERRDSEGYSKEHTIILDQQLSVGRISPSDLIINDSKVSGKHLIIKQEPDGLTISDNMSTNGTRLNGEPLTSIRTLHSGDTVVIGVTTLVICFDE